MTGGTLRRFSHLYEDGVLEIKAGQNQWEREGRDVVKRGTAYKRKDSTKEDTSDLFKT